jgi:hypothetical protein
MGQDVLKENQPRQRKSENGHLRGIEGMQKEVGKARRTGRGLVQIGEETVTDDARAERIESEKPVRGTGVQEINAGGQKEQQGGQVKAADPV